MKNQRNKEFGNGHSSNSIETRRGATNAPQKIRCLILMAGDREEEGKWKFVLLTELLSGEKQRRVSSCKKMRGRKKVLLGEGGPH